MPGVWKVLQFHDWLPFLYNSAYMMLGNEFIHPVLWNLIGWNALKENYLINIFTGSQFWNRQHYGQTIHPTEKMISMNLFRFFVFVYFLTIFARNDLYEISSFKLYIFIKKGNISTCVTTTSLVSLLILGRGLPF